MAIDLTAGIVRILKEDDTTAGTGFVVSDDGWIATCAHVVWLGEARSAGLPKRDTVRLIFHGTREMRVAQVVEEWRRHPDAEDVAILHLEGPLPRAVKALPLGSSRHSRSHDFRSRGYRLAKEFPLGLEAEGRIQGYIAHGSQSVLQLQTGQIDEGMSGAPLWDVQGRRVVGMVNAFWETKRHQDAWLAFATPTETLQAVCPALQISDLCPYRGLQAFTEVDAEFFYGRQRVVERLVDNLRREPRFLAMLGPSGSGKSSLVRAGLIPRLRQGAVPGSDGWSVIVARPADQPFGQLAAQGLAGAAEDLARAAQAWLGRPPDCTRLVLVMDQFEELLVACPGSLRRAFVMQLAGLLEAALPVTVVLVMRDDFYSRFAREAPRLLSWLEQGLVNVPLALEQEELRTIVEEPARAVGLAFEPGLAEAILEDALEAAPEQGGRRGHSTVLPLLEFALTQLWERRQDGMLTHEAYGAIGGVTGGLTQWADLAYYGLDKGRQRLAHRVLTDLVHLGDESQGLPDSRRRRSLDTLCRNEGEREAVHTVLRRLADTRLLVTGRDLQSGREMVELIHDALLREWGLLQDWLREDRRFLAWHQALEGRVQAWVESSPEEPRQRDKGRLMRGRELAEAERWLAERPGSLRPVEQVYVREGTKQQERLRRRRSAVVLLVFLMLSAFAWFQRNQTIYQTNLANTAVAAEGMAEAAKATAEAEALQRATAQVEAVHAKATAETEAYQRATAQAQAEQRAEDIESLDLVDSAQQALSSDDIDVAIALALRANRFQDPPLLSRRTLADIAYTSAIRYRLQGHSDWVWSVAVSPDGRTALSGSFDNTVRLWNLETGQEIRQFQGHRAAVRSVAFSPDGRRALSGSDDHTLILWDIESGAAIAQFSGPDEVHTLAFSPDGNTALSGSIDGSVILWDMETGKEQLYMETNGGGVVDVAYSPDGHSALSGSQDGTVTLWDLDTGREKDRALVHTDGVHSVAFNPEGDLAVSGSADRSIVLWQVQGSTIEAITQAIEHDSWVYSVSFSPVGNTVLSGSADGKMCLWNLDETADLLPLHCYQHPGEIHSVAFSPDGHYALTGTRDRSVTLWDLEDGEEIRRFSVQPVAVRSVAFSPDGQLALSALEDSGLILWDVASGTELRRFKGHTHEVASAAFSPDGRTAISGSYDHSLRLWDVTTGREIRQFIGHTAPVLSVAISPDGSRVLSGGGDADYCLLLWEVASGSQVGRFCGHSNWITSIAFSTDGQTALSSSHDHSMILWDVVQGTEIRRIEGHEDWVLATAFSPDNSTVLSGSADGTVCLWSTDTGAKIRCLEGHRGWVWSVAYHKDGKMALSGATDASLILWDLEAGTEIRRFDGHAGWTRSVAFSPDGHTALSGSADGTMRLWRIHSLEARELCTWIRENRYVRELTDAEREKYHVLSLSDARP